MNTVLPLVHLVDDDDAVRQGLALLLSTVGMQVRTYADPEQFLRAFDPAQAGIILLDVRMPGGSGMGLLDRLGAMNISQPVIILTGHGTVDLCRRAFKAGATEFLEKPVDDEVLIDTLQRALTEHLLNKGRKEAERTARERYLRLSAREREVLELLVAGMTNREIGHALDLSPRTVEVHRAHLVEKLETETLAQLIRQYAPLVDAPHELQ
ncbi:response regulator transcription factor [Noviherbaspirillum saxi]|uniref:DNA-binding response regulator n=1 Tax=Noviherbaspirillum saxi TaxID=2320863 RepID=A0A3A3FJ89_9BURK|nr:response regulator [Noviherbaspirillum saxi]RJF95314.1 DNA-binding response regulator [Noviherbaspirillum saxi]